MRLKNLSWSPADGLMLDLASALQFALLTAKTPSRYCGPPTVAEGIDAQIRRWLAPSPEVCYQSKALRSARENSFPRGVQFRQLFQSTRRRQILVTRSYHFSHPG
jgi:hypothetical protein